MLYLQPKLLECHFCEDAIAEVIFPSGQGLCLKCYDILSPHMPPVDYKKLSPPITLGTLRVAGSLEEMKKAIVMMLKNDGMSISNIARRLEITRATVYSLLGRKFPCTSKT